MEVHGRARREAAHRHKSECKVNLGNRKYSRSNSLWQMTTKTVSQNHAWRRWRMELRQLTVYEHFGLVNMRAINTGGKAYGTGGPWPALSPARPLWREKWDFLPKYETECRMYSKFLSRQRHLANNPASDTLATYGAI